jgi:hypothetical protein
LPNLVIQIVDLGNDLVTPVSNRFEHVR